MLQLVHLLLVDVPSRYASRYHLLNLCKRLHVQHHRIKWLIHRPLGALHLHFHKPLHGGKQQDFDNFQVFSPLLCLLNDIYPRFLLLLSVC